MSKYPKIRPNKEFGFSRIIFFNKISYESLHEKFWGVELFDIEARRNAFILVKGRSSLISNFLGSIFSKENKYLSLTDQSIFIRLFNYEYDPFNYEFDEYDKIIEEEISYDDLKSIKWIKEKSKVPFVYNAVLQINGKKHSYFEDVNKKDFIFLEKLFEYISINQ